MHTITLEPGKAFHTHRGALAHDALIGLPDGSVVTTSGGGTYLALRPLLSDYVLSMPRGAAVIYPKDAGADRRMGDVFPGATGARGRRRVGRADLLAAAGRRRHRPAALVRAARRTSPTSPARNVEAFFGGPHPAWQLHVGDVAERAAPRPSVDRIVLDMLAPWECLDAVSRALVPGGVLICYVATTTQLSELVEALREHGGFTEPPAWESLVRDWHAEGLAVRPRPPDDRAHRLPGLGPPAGRRGRRRPPGAGGPPRARTARAPRSPEKAERRACRGRRTDIGISTTRNHAGSPATCRM